MACSPPIHNLFEFFARSRVYGRRETWGVDKAGCGKRGFGGSLWVVMVLDRFGVRRRWRGAGGGEKGLGERFRIEFSPKSSTFAVKQVSVS